MPLLPPILPHQLWNIRDNIYQAKGQNFWFDKLRDDRYPGVRDFEMEKLRGNFWLPFNFIPSFNCRSSVECAQYCDRMVSECTAVTYELSSRNCSFQKITDLYTVFEEGQTSFTEVLVNEAGSLERGRRKLRVTLAKYNFYSLPCNSSTHIYLWHE